MKKWFGKEVKIALSVLASILILYVGINYLKGINVMKPSNYYYVQFPNVAGLAQSAPVSCRKRSEELVLIMSAPL